MPGDSSASEDAQTSRATSAEPVPDSDLPQPAGEPSVELETQRQVHLEHAPEISRVKQTKRRKTHVRPVILRRSPRINQQSAEAALAVEGGGIQCTQTTQLQGGYG
jgi:hypothetical protein